MKALLRKLWTYPLRGKRLVTTRKLRIFCDGGDPRWRWLPKFHKSYYDPYWGMKGFAMYLWGREVNFSFGDDIHGLYL